MELIINLILDLNDVRIKNYMCFINKFVAIDLFNLFDQMDR